MDAKSSRLTGGREVPEHKPAVSFDIGQEQAPNPVWLRAFASSVKHEAVLLEGFDADLARRFREASVAACEPPLRVALTNLVAANALRQASVALLQLADAMDEGVDAQGPIRFPALAIARMSRDGAEG